MNRKKWRTTKENDEEEVGTNMIVTMQEEINKG